MSQSIQPRVDNRCRECPTGVYEYEEQVRDARGDLKSLFKCGDCGHEVRVQ